MKKIGSLIAPLIKEFGIEEAVRLEEVKKKWTILFNEPLSLHMYPSRLSKGELLINVDSPLWLQQLSFLKTQIIKNLTPFEIRDVRFRLGRVASPQKDEAARLPSSKPVIGNDALRQIEDTIAGIGDSAIKESIRKVMERALRSKRSRDA